MNNDDYSLTITTASGATGKTSFTPYTPWLFGDGANITLSPAP